MTDPAQAEANLSSNKQFLTNRRMLWLVGLALFLALLVLFIADNFVLVEMRLFTLRIRARLAWLLLVSLLIGIALGLSVGSMRRRQDHN